MNGKGSNRRPGTGYEDGWARIWGGGKDEAPPPAYTLHVREHGLVELVCTAHGTGHPSQRLTEVLGARPWQPPDDVHGCCGCCWKDSEFTQAEEYWAKKGNFDVS